VAIDGQVCCQLLNAGVAGMCDFMTVADLNITLAQVCCELGLLKVQQILSGVNKHQPLAVAALQMQACHVSLGWTTKRTTVREGLCDLPSSSLQHPSERLM
jgi:hypothetical protein